MFLASEIMRRAQIVLQDIGGTRWPLTELAWWINDGLSDISLYKPSARTENVVIPLIPGTRQTLPDTARALLRVTCNINSTTPRSAGRAVRTATRSLMDHSAPDWHDTTVYPAAKAVDCLIHDEMDQRAFYVFPANDGTGAVEALVSVNPAEIAATDDGPELMSAYDVAVDIDDAYRTCLVDYILYRAFQKDSVLPGNAMRAQSHLSAFANALGVKLKNEIRAQPKSTNSVGVPSAGPEAG